ncbi:hypothetical protein [Nonomuraea sp. NPDC050643]|uniref:hypothetical protein n=1 Tax=Nonomuraea sp. NPDC050643 TaxID=3155660 RepID=UPI0033F8D55D
MRNLVRAVAIAVALGAGSMTAANAETLVFVGGFLWKEDCLVVQNEFRRYYRIVTYCTPNEQHYYFEYLK